MKDRQSGIELMRVLAMLMIVAGHFLRQGGLEAEHPSFGMYVASSGARWAVNLFLIVGVWFMVDMRFKAKRVLDLYLTVLTFTVPLTVLALLCGAHPSAKDILRGFLPFTGRALWFASAYITLLLLTPWLRFVFALPRRSQTLLMLLLTIFLPGVCTLPDMQASYVLDSVWFIYVYLLIGSLKPYVKVNSMWRWCGLIVGVVLYLSLVGIRTFCGGFSQSYAIQCLSDFKTLPNFGSALLVAYFFIGLDIGVLRTVNRLAGGAFAVYVIHQTPAFFPFLWERVRVISDLFPQSLWWAYAFCSVIGVYVGGYMLDSLRRYCFASFFGQSKWYNGLCRIIDRQFDVEVK